MQASQFEKFCSIAYDKAGIKLNKGKEELVSARVAKRLRALNLDEIGEYLQLLENDATGEELIQFLDVISTNYTKFYREEDHFEMLTHYLKNWINEGHQRFRIWCAASSSGEEPYTLAMTLAEAVNGKNIDFRILATDISTKVLDQAQKGIYDAAKLEPVKKAYRTKYFTRLGKRSDSNCLFEAKPELKNKIAFKRLNLTEIPFPMSGPMDAIFCRNVMIYFDNKGRQTLISEIERLLRPGGLLVIGHTETLSAIRHDFECIKPSVYQKPMRTLH